MSERALRPFWLHQLVEYVIGLVLVAMGMQSPDPLVPTLAGGLVILNAAIAVGPLSAFRIANRAVHRVLDLVVIAAIVAGAIQPWVSVDNATRGIMLGVAFVLGSVWLYTDFAERKARSARRAAQSGDRGEAIGRSAGRMAGNAVSAWRNRDRSDAG